MFSVFEVKTRNVIHILIWIGTYASIVHPVKKDLKRYSLDYIIESALSMLHPVVAAGSDRCEKFKSYFGLTYDQMLGRNGTDFEEVLHLDLITKNGSTKFNITSVKQLAKIMEDGSKTIVILVHGFMESSDGLMVQALAPEYLKKPSLYKVLALDGRKLIRLEYIRSSTYARFIGEKLGILLAGVIKSGVEANKLTMVGHSLGAHIAGIAGKQVLKITGHRIDSITALDPAGPCFTDVDAGGRLSRGDAEYVQVVHTNGGILGLKEPVGDIDFFPNGGWTQPGCFLTFCDHSRAWELYAEAITNADRFAARKCENWTMFIQRKCSKNNLLYLGTMHEANPTGMYFFLTASRSPFGLGSSGSG